MSPPLLATTQMTNGILMPFVSVWLSSNALPICRYTCHRLWRQRRRWKNQESFDRLLFMHQRNSSLCLSTRSNSSRSHSRRNSSSPSRSSRCNSHEVVLQSMDHGMPSRRQCLLGHTRPHSRRAATTSLDCSHPVQPRRSRLWSRKAQQPARFIQPVRQD
jgi:hypothetical protein